MNNPRQHWISAFGGESKITQNCRAPQNHHPLYGRLSNLRYIMIIAYFPAKRRIYSNTIVKSAWKMILQQSRGDSKVLLMALYLPPCLGELAWIFNSHSLHCSFYNNDVKTSISDCFICLNFAEWERLDRFIDFLGKLSTATPADWISILFSLSLPFHSFTYYRFYL